MADFAGEIFSAPALVEGLPDPVPGEILSSSVTVHFKMMGQDHNNSNLDTWRVTGSADSTGAQYAGSLATPLRNITVAATWSQ